MLGTQYLIWLDQKDCLCGMQRESHSKKLSSGDDDARTIIWIFQSAILITLFLEGVNSFPSSLEVELAVEVCCGHGTVIVLLDPLR